MFTDIVNYTIIQYNIYCNVTFSTWKLLHVHFHIVRQLKFLQILFQSYFFKQFLKANVDFGQV